MEEETKHGRADCGCPPLCVSGAYSCSDGITLSDSARHKTLIVISDTKLRDKEIILARRYQLGFATILGLMILVFDMYCAATTGHGYKSPEWAIAIITAVYLGASGNQVLSMIGGALKGRREAEEEPERKASRRKPRL